LGQEENGRVEMDLGTGINFQAFISDIGQVVVCWILTVGMILGCH
jgi:hypothetical protein